MSATPAKYRHVLRFIDGMMGLIIIVAVILIATLYTIQQTDNKSLARVQLYNLGSLTLTQQLADDTHKLAHVEMDLALNGASGTSRQSVEASTAPILDSIRDNLAALRELQAQHSDPQIAAVLDRAILQFQPIERLRLNAGVFTDVFDKLEELAGSIEKLDRLHAAAARHSLDNLDAGASRTWPLIGVLWISLGVGIALFWYLFRISRIILARQAKTEEALAASHERMHHMQKLDALGQLVGGVAHDFNNLLTAIIGQASLLRRRWADDDRSDSSLEQIQRAAKQAASLTQQLLGFSHRQRIEPIVMNLNPLVEKMTPMLRRLIGEEIELVATYEEDLNAVELDPGQIEQVIMNLVVNARDAMPFGGKLTITTRNINVDNEHPEPAEIPPGEYVVLSVVDNGVGMDDATRERLFEPFFTTKPKGRGTGLGLSTVHGIVSGAKGHVLVDSYPEDGTRFDIYFPRTLEKPKSSAVPEVPSSAAPGSETVLIVEDDELIRDFLRSGLRDFGYRVMTAADGASGLEICESRQDTIDVVVADVIMPGMNGSDFMQGALRLQPALLPIYMSGYTDDIVLKRGITGSEIPLIRKPFEIEVLVQAIRNGLDRKIGGQ